MAIENHAFKTTNKTLLEFSWNVNFTYKAALVKNTYQYSSSHAFISDFIAHIVGNPIEILNKQIRLQNRNQYTVFDCDDLNFSSQGTLSATGLVVFYAPNNDLDLTNPVVFFFDFGENISLNNPLKVNDEYGIYSVKMYDFSENLLLAESFESQQVGLPWLQLANTEIISGTDRNGQTSKMVRCAYPSSAVSVILKTIDLSEAVTHAKMSYWVFFEDGFDFSGSGNIHGLIPLDSAAEGVQITAEEWAARIQWAASAKVKAANHHQTSGTTTTGVTSSVSDVFKTGQWQLVEIELKLNTSASASDGFAIVSVDGTIYSTNTGIKFRGSIAEGTKIKSLLFLTHSISSAPASTKYARFDDFKVLNME